MKWWAGSFFWRTLAVLVVALVASQGAAFLLFRQQVQQPRWLPQTFLVHRCRPPSPN